jgi:hypothetical protein
MLKVRVRAVAVAAVALALAGLSGLTPASAGGTSVSIDSLNAQVGVVGKVVLRASAVPAPGLGAWTVDVHYDPAKVSIAACAPGVGGLCNAHYNASTVRVTGTSIGGLPGTNDLASIAVACTAAGTSHLELTLSVFADATIGNPRPISATAVDGSVTCAGETPPAPTEEPGPTGTPPPGDHKVPGDANCDGSVDSIDAALILQYTADLIGSVDCPDNADANHDGDAGAIDAAIALQKAAGLL